MKTELLKEREDSVCYNSKNKGKKMKCDGNSVSGSVSQRACVYAGARVVLNPITDAFHLVHGPIGCAAYTWDIRGSLTSDSENYRNSYSTDIREKDVIFGGEKKLAAAIDEIVVAHSPKVIFVYSTCIVGVIGDDIDAVCRMAESKYNIRVIPVKAPGFSGNKAVGYRAACNAILNLMGENNELKVLGINILGDFNLAGEMWIIKNYFKRMGVKVVARITGDSTTDEIKKAPTASLNIVQCAGSMHYLANQMTEKFGIPYINVSFLGLADIKASLTNVAQLSKDKEIIKRTKELIETEEKQIEEKLEYYKKRLIGKKVAIYVGGGFKAISLIKQFRELGMETVMVGTQTGKEEDYDIIKEITNEGTVILDDTNPAELERFILEKNADILVGGVKERPLAYKLGIAFCDHNHERKHALAGFEGAVNFAKEVDLTINSPVWKLI
ncbi:nitrogenase iron-molybdenum cofactor biosynthesis protein NifE [Clostridium estertheticum]|uniref:nitrogenase iron-molybdenum cofactor biosynthesis protein NifE n=1 Tax=Clostridium estertheticum TaxID=238834 RepID=UPI001CF24BE6|nr:nitrogenase iron-molybdenum cofactor biosynthesis protein NifE [Clostridium estertheticum]MCB2307185.1 nitrogenase iron-molybdenum cofactor biosynthesis protein NifE [Clostridium estertheticum]MCB2344113.1 nitrogenase iron-molybdenum cofactor biosynthesis protein NifE [Clostridium estertheticum]MCB2348273.1 nitrogenase iron-molybdenum cofactor biosynthesis protein NifE [Clostridium estertheticum]WAG45904.1 nitrogenase iron-molybdenum cofactor biosynthesis protein NifE [Clostridium estertheti